MFGYFCALELYGTIKPAECPPMNGRMATTLRFLGFGISRRNRSGDERVAHQDSTVTTSRAVKIGAAPSMASAPISG